MLYFAVSLSTSIDMTTFVNGNFMSHIIGGICDKALWRMKCLSLWFLSQFFIVIPIFDEYLYFVFIFWIGSSITICGTITYEKSNWNNVCFGFIFHSLLWVVVIYVFFVFTFLRLLLNAKNIARILNIINFPNFCCHIEH